jgi:hypothetical protein
MSQGVVCGVLTRYSYSRQGEQKRIEQTERRNGRISILGVWQPDRSFMYALACGSFKTESYIKSHRLDCQSKHLRLLGQLDG